MSRANLILILVALLAVTAVTLIEFHRGQPDLHAQPKVKLEADIRALGTALKTYQEYSGAYPTQTQGLDALVTRPIASPVPTTWYQMLRQLPLDPWGQPYVYRIPPQRSHQPYDLFSTGPDRVESADDTGNWAGE